MTQKCYILWEFSASVWPWLSEQSSLTSLGTLRAHVLTFPLLCVKRLSIKPCFVLITIYDTNPVHNFEQMCIHSKRLILVISKYGNTLK